MSSHPPHEETITQHVLEALRRIIRAIDVHSRHLTQRYGLTGPQLLVLKQIAGYDAVNIGDLARTVHLSQATVTGIVDRLERRRLAARHRSTADKRRVLVSATEGGRAVLASAPPLLQEHFIDGLRRLPEADQRQVLASLETIVQLMEAHELSAGPILATGPLGSDATDVPSPEERNHRRGAS
jgi:DNA-binding MarR family transcriptional regulator